jgi:membrane-associated phospholipid phosphatase
MDEAHGDTQTQGVPARFLEYESRALTYRSDGRKLLGALLATTLVCGGLIVWSFLVGETRIIEWAKRAGSEDKLTFDVTSFILAAPRFIMYVVFALLFIIGLDRKQRFWVQVALVVLFLELVFAGGLVRILKIVVGRARPKFGVADFRPFLLTSNLHHSFPSGDSADIATSASFFIYFARRRGLRLAGLAAIAMVMFQRLMLREHHPSDVLAGAYIGLVSSCVMWHWFVVGFPFKRVRAWFGQDAGPPPASSPVPPAPEDVTEPEP